MRSRISAIGRLVALYVEQLVADPDLQIGKAVQTLNLHPHMDHVPPFKAVVQFEDRDLQLLAAWLSSPSRAFGRVH